MSEQLNRRGNCQILPDFPVAPAFSHNPVNLANESFKHQQLVQVLWSVAEDLQDRQAASITHISILTTSVIVEYLSL